MEPGSLLLCPQDLAAGPHNKPAESSPHCHTLFLQEQFLIILT